MRLRPRWRLWSLLGEAASASPSDEAVAAFAFGRVAVQDKKNRSRQTL